MKQVLYFGAEWCSACKYLLPIVTKEAPEKGYKLKQFDVDTEEGAIVAEEKGVKSLPTIIITNEEGIEEKRAVGNTAWNELQ